MGQHSERVLRHWRLDTHRFQGELWHRIEGPPHIGENTQDGGAQDLGHVRERTGQPVVPVALIDAVRGNQRLGAAQGIPLLLQQRARTFDGSSPGPRGRLPRKSLINAVLSQLIQPRQELVAHGIGQASSHLDKTREDCLAIPHRLGEGDVLEQPEVDGDDDANALSCQRPASHQSGVRPRKLEHNVGHAAAELVSQRGVEELGVRYHGVRVGVVVWVDLQADTPHPAAREQEDGT